MGHLGLQSNQRSERVKGAKDEVKPARRASLQLEVMFFQPNLAFVAFVGWWVVYVVLPVEH